MNRADWKISMWGFFFTEGVSVMPVPVPCCPGSSVSPSPPAPALVGVIPPLQTWGDPTDGWLSRRHLMYNSRKWPPPAWLRQGFCPQHPQIPPKTAPRGRGSLPGRGARWGLGGFWGPRGEGRLWGCVISAVPSPGTPLCHAAAPCPALGVTSPSCPACVHGTFLRQRWGTASTLFIRRAGAG